MKIQLDYDSKKITVEQATNLGEFFIKVKVILPDWRDWELQTNTIVSWSSPIVIKEYPNRPWWEYISDTNIKYVMEEDSNSNTINIQL